MFNDAAGCKRIFLKVGYTDLRKGIPGLTAMIRESFGCDPYEKNVLFLFCGRRTDRIKGLILKEMDAVLFINGFPQTAVFNGRVQKMNLRSVMIRLAYFGLFSVPQASMPDVSKSSIEAL